MAPGNWHSPLSPSGGEFDACRALPPDWLERDALVLLDTAFGSGSRFLEIWTTWRRAPGFQRRLHYIGLSPSLPPAPPQDSNGAPPERELRAKWPLPLPGLHPLFLDEGRVTLTLGVGAPETLLRRLSAQCDALFLDSAAALAASALARLSRPDATFSLSAPSPEAAQALERAGFEFLPLPTPSPREPAFHAFGKRRALQRPRTHSASSATVRREAIILGAGLAGTAVAAALARRGWKTLVLEALQKPAGAASGNRAGVMSPMLSKDDGLAARLSRASFLRLLQELREYGERGIPVHWSGCGVLQMAKEAKEERLFEEILQLHRYPEQYVQFFSKAQASRAIGHEAAAGGLFFPEGGWVNPPSLCRARLQAFGSIQSIWGCRAARIEAERGAWRVLGEEGQLLGEAPVVIVANAWEAAHFSQTAFLPFKKVRGQVTHVPEGLLPALPHVLSRDGYLTPGHEGFSSLGATYDFQRVDLAPDDASHRRNLARLPELLPAQSPVLNLETLSGRVGLRTLTPDRMPIVGAVPESAGASGTPSGGCGRIPGLYCALGLGSRGLVWSTLMGEYLAASLCGEPSPLTLDLAEALDPARFVGPAGKGKSGSGQKRAAR